jgi:glycosyltransferase involved in cell wall biosynthesis
MIAVMIPCYNAQGTIDRALRSCLAQSDVREIILIDDGSTDGTLALLEGYAAQYPQVKVLRMPQNSGAAMARNWGVLHSHAPYLAFLDADDEYLGDAFGFSLRALAAHKSLAAIKLPCEFVGWPADVVEHASFGGTCQTLVNTFAGNLLIRREVFMAMGMFPDDAVFRAQGGEDCAFMMALTDHFVVGQVKAEPSAVAIYYHDNSHGYRFFKIEQGESAPEMSFDTIEASRIFIEQTQTRLQALHDLRSSELGKGFQPIWRRTP